MKDFTTINNKAYAEHLAFKYELILAGRMANYITVSIIAVICLIEYLRLIVG